MQSVNELKRLSFFLERGVLVASRVQHTTTFLDDAGNVLGGTEGPVIAMDPHHPAILAAVGDVAAAALVRAQGAESERDALKVNLEEARKSRQAALEAMDEARQERDALRKKYEPKTAQQETPNGKA